MSVFSWLHFVPHLVECSSFIFCSYSFLTATRWHSTGDAKRNEAIKEEFTSRHPFHCRYAVKNDRDNKRTPYRAFFVFCLGSLARSAIARGKAPCQVYFAERIMGISSSISERNSFNFSQRGLVSECSACEERYCQSWM